MAETISKLEFKSPWSEEMDTVLVKKEGNILIISAALSIVNRNPKYFADEKLDCREYDEEHILLWVGEIIRFILETQKELIRRHSQKPDFCDKIDTVVKNVASEFLNEEGSWKV